MYTNVSVIKKKRKIDVIKIQKNEPSTFGDLHNISQQQRSHDSKSFL